MMKFAVRHNGPIAVRYPRGAAYDGLEEYREPMVYGKSEMIYKGKDIALLPVGSMVKTAEEVYHLLKEEEKDPTLVNARFVKPLDTKMLDSLADDHKMLVTMEENVRSGGFGSAVLAYMHERHPQVRVEIVAVPDAFISHGSPDVLKKKWVLMLCPYIRRSRRHTKDERASGCDAGKTRACTVKREGEGHNYVRQCLCGQSERR